MKEKKEFNQQQYIKEYNQAHYKTFKVELKKEEKEELDDLLKLHEIKKSTFLRTAINNFKEDLKMMKYMIVYEDEKMKNENEGTYEYSDCELDNKIFDTLKEAREDFEKFKSYIWKDGNTTIYKRIATLYRVKVNEDNEIDDSFDWEQIDAK